MRRFIYKFFKYLKWCKQGGYTQINLSQIIYPAILEGKKALIIGGSDGIGLAIAKKFISAGASVVITGRSIDRLEKAKKIDSNKLFVLQWDVSDIDLINTNLERVKELMGGIDIVVNNAAFLAYYSNTIEFFDKTMDTNLRALYFMCEACCSFMKKENGKKGGHIVNISSINAYQSNVHPYYISKRAGNAITEGFAKKYAPFNIVVNAVAPGYCDSSINKQDAQKNAYWEDAANNRITTPSEIAELVTFLCSGAADGIVGQTIVCDGGTIL